MAHSSSSSGMFTGTFRKRWAPKNEQEEKLFISGKKDLICFLTILNEGVNPTKLYGKFADQTETEINFQKMGFENFGEFLYECRDTLRLKTDGYGCYLFLKGKGPSDINHVRQLVERQGGKSNTKGFVAKHNNTWDIPIEKLLDLRYDLKASTNPPPPSPSAPRPLVHHRIAVPVSRRRRGTSRSRSRSNPSSRKTTIRSSVPALRPINSAALNLVTNGVPALRPINSAALNLVTNGVPALRPINSAALKLTTNAVPALRPINSAALNSATNGVPALRPINSAAQNLTTINKVPVLKPLNAAALQSQPMLPPLIPNLPPRKPVTAIKTVSKRVVRRSRSSINTSNKVPTLLPLSTIQQMRVMNNTTAPEVSSSSASTASTSQLYNCVLAGDDDDQQGSRNEILWTQPQQVIHRLNYGLEDEDRVDGVVTISRRRPELDQLHLRAEKSSSTVVKIREKPTISNTKSVPQEGNNDCDDLPTTFKFMNIKPARGNKTIFKVERQFKLSNQPFNALLLGADPYGFIYIQKDCQIVQNGFKHFQEQLNSFYSASEQQDEFRMRSDEMKVGILVVFDLMDCGFCRGRIVDVVTDLEYCCIFDIDKCTYHNVRCDDVYHVDEKFSCGRRLPMAIMCLQHGTERIVLTPQFEKVFLKSLEQLTFKITVTKKEDSLLFGIPIVSISCNNQDLLELFVKSRVCEIRGNDDSATSALSEEQQNMLKDLQNKGHILHTNLIA